MQMVPFQINVVLLSFIFIKGNVSQFPQTYKVFSTYNNNHKCLLIIRSSY